MDTKVITTCTNEKINTLTVGGLINKLSMFHNDLPVIASWEGVDAPVIGDNIFLNRFSSSKAQSIDVVCIDVGEQF